MELFNNFTDLFLSVWSKGIYGVDIFQILIGVGIFFIFLIFRGIISKVIIKRLKAIAKKLQINWMILLLMQWKVQLDFYQLF